MENNDNKDSKDNRKEIDLIELFSMFFSAIKGFILQIYNALWWLLAFGIKRFVYILIFGSIGLGIGIYEKVSVNTGFESQLKIRTNALRSYEMKPYFEEITDYLSQKNDDNVSLMKDLFDFDEKTLEDIVSIKSLYYIDVHGNGTIDGIDLKDVRSLEDTVNIRDSLHLCIVATVKDPLTFPKLEKGINHYIQSKEFLQTQNKYRLKKLGEEKQELQHEIDYLDSLQRVVYFNSPKSPSLRQATNGYYLGNVSVQLFHNYKKEIYEALDKISEELDIHKDIYTVLSDFKISNKRTTSTFMQILKPSIIGVLFGYFLALLIYFFRKNYKKYAAQIN